MSGGGGILGESNGGRLCRRPRRSKGEEGMVEKSAGNGWSKGEKEEEEVMDVHCLCRSLSLSLSLSVVWSLEMGEGMK